MKKFGTSAEYGVWRPRKIAGLIHEPKLNWFAVNEIRRDYVHQSRTQGCAALAKKYGVSHNAIHKVVRGKTWKCRVGRGDVPLPTTRNKSNAQMNWFFQQEARAWQNSIKLAEAREHPDPDADIFDLIDDLLNSQIATINP